MESKIYHGDFQPSSFVQPLVAHFNRGNYQVQTIGNGKQMAVQIATHNYARSGGQTAISVQFQKVEDGVAIQIGQQAWLGVAASLGITALSALSNPWNLINRLDDLAQDVESLQLTEDVWKVIEATAAALGAGTELSNRLKRLVCEYCDTANPVGEPRCIGCGAPLGSAQPLTCRHCGFVVRRTEIVCPNCGRQLP